MTTTTKTRTRNRTMRFSAPFYAAAGASDLAYKQLRKLPERVAELRERVAELRPTVTEAVSEPRLRADLDRLRNVARRNAEAFVSSAQEAQERATKYYTRLIKHGERVVGSAFGPEKRSVTAPVRDDNAPQPAVADKATKRARPAAAHK